VEEIMARARTKTSARTAARKPVKSRTKPAHAALAGEILGREGYDAEAVKHVQSLIKKERIKHDPEAQLLEDSACLVFLEYELAEFALKHDEAKLVDILRKTWPKMSARGQQAALALKLPAPLRALVEKALG
jgi:hypothetical protein